MLAVRGCGRLHSRKCCDLVQPVEVEFTGLVPGVLRVSVMLEASRVVWDLTYWVNGIAIQWDGKGQGNGKQDGDGG